jgi:hypothetical protein
MANVRLNQTLQLFGLIGRFYGLFITAETFFFRFCAPDAIRDR